MLSARGLTVDDIALRVHRAKDTIKSRRKAIFEKLGVSSISEAIAFAANYKLI
ncbi:MAG: LuxR C-terminal-related transcriptional regulator [Muribaculaceae bacterium]|nr:LuxR C-terminal-related transcriptional regulator [Muribaculaceae bacterium]